MAYVEFLRVRRALAIYTGIIAVTIVLIVLAVKLGHTGDHVTIAVGSGKAAHAPGGRAGMFDGMRVPLGMLLGAAGYCAVVFATVLASSLNTENSHAHFSYTKPISRARLGVAYFAVDAAGIAAAFVVAFLLIGIVPLLAFGVLSRVYFDAQGVWIGALGLGIAYMWYGIVQAATSSYVGHGGMVRGLSWVFFAVLAGLSGATFLGPALLGVVHALNLLNPLAYFSSLTQQHSGNVVEARSTLGLALQPRVFLAFFIALVAGASALVLQKRLEV